MKKKNIKSSTPYKSNAFLANLSTSSLNSNGMYHNLCDETFIRYRRQGWYSLDKIALAAPPSSFARRTLALRGNVMDIDSDHMRVCCCAGTRWRSGNRGNVAWQPRRPCTWKCFGIKHKKFALRHARGLKPCVGSCVNGMSELSIRVTEATHNQFKPVQKKVNCLQAQRSIQRTAISISKKMNYFTQFEVNVNALQWSEMRWTGEDLRKITLRKGPQDMQTMSTAVFTVALLQFKNNLSRWTSVLQNEISSSKPYSSLDSQRRTPPCLRRAFLARWSRSSATLWGWLGRAGGTFDLRP